MNSNIYKQMSDLQEFRNSNDVAFLGSIQLNELDIATNQHIKSTYDIFVSLEDSPYGTVFKFYNKNNELIAIDLNDGQGVIPTAKFMDKITPESLKVLEHFSYAPQSSLNQLNYDLEKIADTLGFSKEELQSISEVAKSKEESTIKQDDDRIQLNVKEKNARTQQKKDKKQSSQKEKKIQALEKQL